MLSCLALSFRVLFTVLFSIVITSLGEERESWFMCFSCDCLLILHA